MHAGDLGTGATLLGTGTLLIVAAIMYGNPILIPFSYVLIGAGGGLFLRGIAHGIRWSLLLLLTLGTLALPLSILLIATGRRTHGLALASLSLGWTLALTAIGLYRQASTPARPPTHTAIPGQTGPPDKP